MPGPYRSQSSRSDKRTRPYPKPGPLAPNLPQFTWNFYQGVTKIFLPEPYDPNSSPSGGGQMANAETGHSHDQNSDQLGEYEVPTPTDMDFPGQMANVEAGPSYDQNEHSLGDHTAPMQPLTNGGISQHDDSGDHQGHAEQPPPILAESVEISSNAEAGSADSEEDYSYHDFSDGFDNPVAVRRVAAMIDEMTGLDVARKLAKNGKYETINDLANGLKSGQTLGIMVEDVEKMSGALKKLVRTLDHSNVKMKAVSFSKVLASDCKHMGLNTKSTPTPTNIENQKVMDCLSKFFKTNLEQTKFATLQNELKDPSTISNLAASIAQISRTANDDTEPFSRKIIDQFALSMHNTFEKLGLASYEIVELRIASAEAPVGISRDGYLTILTGSTDYGFFSSVDYTQTELKTFCDESKSSGVNTLLRAVKLNNVEFLPIEAKSKDYSRCLAVCLPQMGAECISTMKFTRQKEMVWCLSTGSTWIFGTIRLKDDGTYIMRMAEPMEFQLIDADKGSNLETVRHIFWAMLYWTVAPAREIAKQVFGD